MDSDHDSIDDSDISDVSLTVSYESEDEFGHSSTDSNAPVAAY